MGKINYFLFVMLLLTGLLNSFSLLADDDVKLDLQTSRTLVSGILRDGEKLATGHIAKVASHSGFQLWINDSGLDISKNSYLLSGQMKSENKLRVRIVSSKQLVGANNKMGFVINSTNNNEEFYVVTDGEQVIHPDIYSLDVLGAAVVTISADNIGVTDDYKRVSVSVRFASDVKLYHELHTTANSFRISDMATVTGNQAVVNKALMVAQGKIMVASGEWETADKIAIRFTSGCYEHGKLTPGNISVCNVSGGRNNAAVLLVQLQEQNGQDVIVIDDDGWGIISDNTGTAYYNVRISPTQDVKVVNDLVGEFSFGIDAAVYVD